MNCRVEIDFSFFGGMSVPSLYLYSTDSKEVLISETLFKQRNDFINKSKIEIDLHVNGLFKDNTYSLASNLCCKACAFVFPEIYPQNLNARLNDNCPIVLQHTVVRTDDEVYLVELVS